MSAPPWLEAGAAHVWRPYCQHETAPPPLPVVSASGSRLVLADGRELVDGTASWWTAAHGYRLPEIQERVEAQLRRLPHVAFGGLANEAAYSLAERLAKMLAPLTRVFFVESGSVSVEVALKMALQSFSNRGAPRRKIVCFANAYHGDTFATMALSDPLTGMHHAFTGMGVEAVHLPLPHAEDGGAFEKAFAAIDGVACAIVEPLVQCAGGMVFHGPAELERIRRACDHAGAWLVYDEIATGFHRTGPRFALDSTIAKPDIVTIGKALTGGTLPLAAVIASEAVFAAFSSPKAEHALQHGPTYMGNALACAAAHASLDLFEKTDYSVMVSRLESTLRSSFEGFRGRPHVKDVRVLGAIAAIEMEPGTAPASAAFVERGVFLRPLRLPHADVLYTMPPLTIGAADLDVLTTAIDAELPR
ncbi:MAG TPA: adenosylmethionine--8-amino-7-oxononanoate transaminase [Polyangiaceae bacterium]